MLQEDTISLSQLRLLYTHGQLPRDALVWAVTGGTEWQRLGGLMDELARADGEAPAPSGVLFRGPPRTLNAL